MLEEKTPDEKETIEEIRKPVGRPRWAIPLVTIVIIIFFLWYFSRSCGETKPNVGESPNTGMKIHHENIIPIVYTTRPDLKRA
ncbi:MAG: hypothetical protein ABI136_00165 [Ginsengibacter sp.]